MRKQIISAIERLNYRVTVGDVAAKAGLDINRTYTELLTLASDVGGHLKVSKSGEIVFQFPQQIRTILYQKFWKVRLHQFWKIVCKLLLYLFRISFGILLILSIAFQVIAIVIIAIAAITRENSYPSLTSNNVFITSFKRRKKSSFDRESNSFISDEREQVAEINFLEAVFSFLFGDGNPNKDLEKRRWLLINDVIKNNRGAIVAEQIAPCLDEINRKSWQSEDYMLPILIRFNGYPKVSPQGEIIYHFPNLQTTVNSSQDQRKSEYLQENFWQFSKASYSQLRQTLELGCLNLILALTLGFMLKSNIITQMDISITSLMKSYWIFLVYSISFLLIPIIRSELLDRKNHKIEVRNQRRKARIQILKSCDRKLLSKLAYASQFQSQNIIQKEDIIYSTERNLLEQNQQEN